VDSSDAGNPAGIDALEFLDLTLLERSGRGGLRRAEEEGSEGKKEEEGSFHRRTVRG
jgi:hypothetical protein